MTTIAPAFAPASYAPDPVLAGLSAVFMDDPLAPVLTDPRTPGRDDKVAIHEDTLLVGWCETYSPYGIACVNECKKRLLDTKSRQAARLGMHLRLLYTVGPNEEGWAHAHSLLECGWQLGDDADINGVRDTLVDEYTDGHIDLRGYRYGGGWVAYIVGHARKTPWAETIEATLEVVCPGGPGCADGCRVPLDDPQFRDPRRYRAAGIPARLAGTATAIKEQVRLQSGAARLLNINHDLIHVDGRDAEPGTGTEDVSALTKVLEHLRGGQSQRSIAAKLRIGRHRIRDLERTLRDAGLLDEGAPARVPISLLRGLVRTDAEETSRSNLVEFEEKILVLHRAGTGAGEIVRRLQHAHPTLETSERSVRRFLDALSERDARRSSRRAWAIVDGRQLRRLRGEETNSWIRPWVLVMAMPSTGRVYAHAVTKIDARTWSEFHEAAFRALGVVPERVAAAPDAVAAVRARFQDELALREYSEVARNHGFEVCPRAVVPDTMKGLATAARLAANRIDTIEDVSAALAAWCGLALPPCTENAGVTVWKSAKVAVDNHLKFEGARYSVPSYLIGEHVQVSCSHGEVRVYAHGQRIAAHAQRRRGRSTHPDHEVHEPLPQQRRAIDDLLSRARRVSPDAEREVREAVSAASFTVTHGRAQAILARHAKAGPLVVDPPMQLDRDDRHRVHVPAERRGVVRVLRGVTTADALERALAR